MPIDGLTLLLIVLILIVAGAFIGALARISR